LFWAGKAARDEAPLGGRTRAAQHGMGERMRRQGRTNGAGAGCSSQAQGGRPGAIDACGRPAVLGRAGPCRAALGRAGPRWAVPGSRRASRLVQRVPITAAARKLWRLSKPCQPCQQQARPTAGAWTQEHNAAHAHAPRRQRRHRRCLQAQAQACRPDARVCRRVFAPRHRIVA
jgi:hypothetical protein